MQEDVNENLKRVTSSLKGVSSSKGSKHHEAMEQKHAEEALQNSNEQLTDVLESISDGFFTVDKNFKITYFNKSAEELLGRKAEEVLGHHLFDEAFPEAKDSIFEQNYKQALRTQKPVSFESYFPVEPYENWYAVRVYPYQDGLSMYFQVITKRKQIEEALRESQRQLSIRNKIVEIFLTIPDDEIYGAVLNVLLKAMESKYGIFGYIDEHERLIIPSMTRDIWEKCQVPDKTIVYSRDKWGGIWGRALKEKKSLYANEGLHVPEGHVPITRVLVVPVMYGSQVIGLLEVANKSTDYNHKDQEFLESIAGKIAPILNARLQRDREERERKLAEEQINNLARFPSENPFPILRISQDGTVLYSNPPGLVLLEQWNCKTGQKAPKDWCKLVSKALKSKRYQVKELNCDKKIFSFAIAPVVDEGYVNLYGRDITKRKQAEDALQKSLDELDLKVKQRTAELAQTVTALRDEVRERINAEKKLKERTRDLDAFFSNTITPLVILDREFNFIRMNKAYADACQRDISEFSGHNHFEFYPHEENQRIFEAVVKTKTLYQASAKPFTFPDHPEWGVTYWDWVLVPILGDDGEVELLILSLKDVTERKSAEIRREVTNSLLELFVQKTSRKEYLDSVVEVIHDWSGCRCVGIRLVNSDGYIPYESHVGFSEEFLLTENILSLNKDICTCVRVVTKDNDPHGEKVMTERGSFRCDDTIEFVNSLAEDEKDLYRSHCSKCGLASVAVVPIRYRQNILGAVHLADEGRNKVPLETIEFLEDMAALIGEAIHRFNVEESLRLNEERLLEAQRLAHLGNWEWDIIKNNLWWSDEVYRIFGVEPGQFGATYEAFLSYVHPQDRELVKKSVNEALYKGKSYNIDHRVIRPDGSERIVHEKAEVTYDSNHKPIKMIGTVHDITEQKKTENEIRDNQRKLRALTAELQLVEEQERHRIAQDLHDSVGQILAFSCGGLKTLQKSLPDKAAKSVQKITNQLDTAVEQARTLSFDLSPSTLYDFGFEVAVEDLVDRMAEEKKLRCQFENCSLPKPLTDDVKVLLYRSVRELLINAIKHAGASLLRVELLRSSSDIYITVEDDGKGFDVSVLDYSPTKRKGFGIFSIHERLSHIGGQLKIESDKGKGTKAVLIAPLDI